MVFILLLVSVRLVAGTIVPNFALAAIDEGDDRFRPGVVVSADIDKEYRGDFTMYGRRYGPVLERTYIISMSKYFDIYRLFKSEVIFGSFGVNALDETIAIELPEESDSEHNFNLGVTIGVHYNFNFNDEFSLQTSWQSHIYLAGSAGILMSTGRKQVISTGVSYSF